jgi:hypothetical protein
MGDTVPFMFGVDTVVEQAKFFNDVAIDIGQERKSNGELVGKTLQDLDWIWAYGQDLDAGLFKLGQGALQLDQLRFAKASPGGTAVKQHQGGAAVAPVRKMPGAALLIGQLKVGQQSADGWAGVKTVGVSVAGGCKYRIQIWH